MTALIAASDLKFEDIEKQSMYETISFDEVHKEIVELKVLSLFTFLPAFDFYLSLWPE